MTQEARKKHLAAGITEYIWRTSGDDSVQPAHKALEGRRFRYAEPPPVIDPATGERAHPGEAAGCRCTAEPVIEGFDD